MIIILLMMIIFIVINFDYFLKNPKKPINNEDYDNGFTKISSIIIL